MLLEGFLRVRGEEFVRMREAEDRNGREKGTEDGEGWFKSFMRRVRRTAVSPKDAEVRPGAGMTSDGSEQTDTTRLAGSTSSAIGLSTTQKVTDASDRKEVRSSRTWFESSLIQNCRAVIRLSMILFSL